MEYEDWIYGKREQTEEVLKELQIKRRTVLTEFDRCLDTTKKVNLQYQLNGIVEKINRFQKALNYGYDRR